MASDGYWRYSDPRYQPAQPAPSVTLKRPRTDYGEIPGGSAIPGYYPREEEHIGHFSRENEYIEASYDRYLQNGISSYGSGDSVRSVTGGVRGHPVDDPLRPVAGSVRGHLVDDPLRSVAGGVRGHPVDDPRLIGVGGVDGRAVGYRSGRSETSLPPDASNTLFVEGLPSNCTRREVSHVFRPFVGFREVRLVSKESRHPGGDPLILCFVDFSTASQAAVALEALQGYKFDENDRESANLRLQFARFPGPRSAGGPRGRR
ncbi:RNA-binding protein 2-like isoform X1 [Dioscorea cayenensis subsp. rotundata]|uniref:RNA-binding protein 2-like isoform X1 n=1 Tax=Dioscorea cayennensis subsp. rotundata TaxID=55577 RepID=A0AB40CQ00_DIOCR|nr:RNA-binding protein 2-like isoform X1 [Dioscorea cayenensis subsp. rotundata]